ncbi:MAG: transposase [Planctomycetota bacterium]
MWAYIGNSNDVVFDFTTTRSREGPIKFLGNYCGYVQADAYSGYDEFFRKSDADEKYSSAQLLQARQTEAKPILKEIKTILDGYKKEVLPKSPIGKAVTYSLNQWEALIRYVDDPMLDIDNDTSERTLRMVVIGRKNYLFAGSEAGAKRAAIIYSLVASCKLNGLDPFVYFRDVLKRVSIHPADKIDELLPSNWKMPNSGAEDDGVVKNQIVKVA